MLEGRIEKTLRRKVKERGGECLKFVSPGTSGVPDRIIFLPGGVIRLAETKAPGRKPRAVQSAVHRRLAELGVQVAVIDSLEAVRSFVEEACNGI